jgi:hypothetical protein
MNIGTNKNLITLLMNLVNLINMNPAVKNPTLIPPLFTELRKLYKPSNSI